MVLYYILNQVCERFNDGVKLVDVVEVAKILLNACLRSTVTNTGHVYNTARHYHMDMLFF